ncbi:MAG: alpha-L-fucosidase, partial [Oscillospiraceae bacterium]|nr:alpha-L-fucosidase [Oscillospiraceae bacterium]
MVEFLKEAARVVPSKRQLDWFEMERYAFVHYGVNTYTDREWGEGTEDEKIFNPTALDCDQWVEAVKSAGLKGLILTAKHHDGFCLWPSKYTEHSVKNSPYKGDVVREAAEACKRGGIKFGFYLSPWDRNSKYYGTPEYNDYFCNQLTELLTGYGDIFCVWFDNACGEGENGKKQEYDFPRYFELIRKYQPNAVIFNDAGPDVRWCGNEAGTGRHAEWAVVPKELCFRAEAQTGAGPEAGSLDGVYNSDADIGALSQIRYSRGLCFVPSEFDMSIRPGWFYHAGEEPHSVERLMRTYITSVGGNGCFNLNVPPMPNGRFDPRDIRRLAEFGDAL